MAVEYMQSTDGYLTFGGTLAVTDTAATTNFDRTQEYLKVVNTGSYDVIMSFGRHTFVVLHPNDTWENDCELDSITYWTRSGTGEITITTKVYGNTEMTVAKYMAFENLRANGSTGMVLDGSVEASSAGTVNTAIAGEDEKYTKEFAFNMEATAGTKHTWFDGVFPVTVTVTSTSGVATLLNEYASVVNGDVTVTLEYTGEWAEGDTVAVKLTGGTQLGYTVADKTVTDTFTA